MIKVDIEKTAVDIVEVLHENNIPVSFISPIFDRAKEIAETCAFINSPKAGKLALEGRCKNDI